VSWLEDVEDREQLLAQGSLPSQAGLVKFFSHKKNRTISQCHPFTWISFWLPTRNIFSFCLPNLDGLLSSISAQEEKCSRYIIFSENIFFHRKKFVVIFILKVVYSIQAPSFE
jgi:hypothetical protein